MLTMLTVFRGRVYPPRATTTSHAVPTAPTSLLNIRTGKLRRGAATDAGRRAPPPDIVSTVSIVSTDASRRHVAFETYDARCPTSFQSRITGSSR